MDGSYQDMPSGIKTVCIRACLQACRWCCAIGAPSGAEVGESSLTTEDLTGFSDRLERASGFRYNPSMKTTYLFSLALLVVALASASSAKTAVHLKDAQGKAVGTATLWKSGTGIGMEANLENLPAGVHAIHFHQNAKCDAPDFKSAGPHFNPDGKKHGLENPEGHHNGDNPNFTVGADGKAHFKAENKDVTLGKDSHSLFSNGGTALIVHAQADDQKTDPAGNAGDRIACGVIKK